MNRRDFFRGVAAAAASVAAAPLPAELAPKLVAFDFETRPLWVKAGVELPATVWYITGPAGNLQWLAIPAPSLYPQLVARAKRLGHGS